ncbi:MAG: phage major capsid protein, partial [Christensenellaceae bacterium]|nr:phage major capsid protein [Christensenellaceae bacterium]
LPLSSGNNYAACTVGLKNIYGTIELSDKVIRSSANNAGGVVSVLSDEMNGLLEAAKYNFSRMLWQNGNGTIATLDTSIFTPEATCFMVADAKALSIGMIVDLYTSAGAAVASQLRITNIDLGQNLVNFTPALESSQLTGLANATLTLQQSKGAEINGIPYIFGDGSDFYGMTTASVPHLLGRSFTCTTPKPFSIKRMQEIVDEIESAHGTAPNMIICSYQVRRKYLELLADTRSNIDYLNVDGGFKAVSFNGIPVIADKFCGKQQMYFLNTNDFKLAQLCDWQWLEGENGNILKQIDRKPAFMATLVKYANLICTRPFAQARLSSIII